MNLGKLVQRRVIAGGSGGAVLVPEGHYLKVIDVQGSQTCSLIALNPAEPRQFLSGSYTRVYYSFKLNTERTIVVGEPLLDNTRHPMLFVEEDTIGVHDWLLSANKTVAAAALAEFSIPLLVMPDPLNLFLKAEWDSEGKLVSCSAASKAGDYVLFRALRTMLAVAMAYNRFPSMIADRTPSDILCEVYSPVNEQRQKA